MKPSKNESRWDRVMATLPRLLLFLLMARG